MSGTTPSSGRRRVIDNQGRLAVRRRRRPSDQYRRPRPIVAAHRQAYTVRMLLRRLSGKSVGDYIDDVPAGDVVVIDNQGRLDATVWGDILTTVAHRNGVAGTVIDGVCATCSERRNSTSPSTPEPTRCAPARTASPPRHTSSRCSSPGSVSNPAIGCAVTPTGRSAARLRSRLPDIDRRRADRLLRLGTVLAAAPTRRPMERSGDFNYHQLQTPADHA